MAMKSQGPGKKEAKEMIAKSLVSFIYSITGSKGGSTIGSESADGVTDDIMEQVTVAAGQLQAISKGRSCRGRSHKKL